MNLLQKLFFIILSLVPMHFMHGAACDDKKEATKECVDFLIEVKNRNQVMNDFILICGDVALCELVFAYPYEKNVVEIIKIEVIDQKNQRKGYGKKALELFEAYIRKYAPHIKKIRVDSLFEMRGFYEKCGYVWTKEVNVDCLVFEKNL